MDGDDEGADAEGEPASKAKQSGPAETKRFAYHQPFMKVKEIREDVALDPNVEDSDLFAGEWLAKHGGKTAGSDSADS